MRMCAYGPSGPPPTTAVGLPDPDSVDLAVEVFRMLADGTRVRLLWLLLDEESPVGDLAQAVGKPQAATSQHLAKLRLARLVSTRRQGNQVFYRLANDHVRQLVIDAVHHAEHAGPGVPPHHQRGTYPLTVTPRTAESTPPDRTTLTTTTPGASR
jgi:ArsR family transcriptional regulator, zinc-responsive transcriptional repressor